MLPLTQNFLHSSRNRNLMSRSLFEQASILLMNVDFLELADSVDSDPKLTIFSLEIKYFGKG